MDKKLEILVERARRSTMTPSEQEAQRVAYAYGNAPKNDTNTKETVKAALTASTVTRTS